MTIASALFDQEQRMVFGAETHRLFARMLASSSEESEVRDPWDTAMWKMPATVVSGRRDVVERRMRRGGHERCRRRKSSVARLKVSGSS